MIRVLNLHKSHPVHQEEIADGIATLVIVLFHTDAIAHFLARELFRLQFLVALMQPKNSQRKNISKPKENLLHRILTTSRKSLILNGEMNREYDAADLRYVSAMISNGNSQMWIKREGV